MAGRQACSRAPWWRWIITLATFTLYFLVLGPQFNFSILYLSLQDEFESTAALTGWLGSLSAAVARLFSPATVLLEQRLSKRALALLGLVLYCAGLLMTSFVPALGYAFVTYGVLAGAGANLALHSSMELVLAWFAKGNFARASAIALLGSTFGLLAFSPLLTVLIDSLGWRNALRILGGGIFVVGVADGLLLTEPPGTADGPSASQNRSGDTEAAGRQSEHPPGYDRVAMEEVDERRGGSAAAGNGTDDEGDVIASPREGQGTKRDWRRVWRMVLTLELWLWAVGNFFTFVGWTFFNVNFASYMDEIGLRSDEIAYVIMALAVGELGGKVLVACVGDRLPCKYLYVVVSSCLLAAVPMGVMTVTSTFAALMPIAVGVYAALYAAGAELFLETYGTGSVMVLTLFPTGFGTLVSAPLSGSLVDVTGSYFVSLVVIAAVFVCASVAFLFIPVWRWIRSRGSRG